MKLIITEGSERREIEVTTETLRGLDLVFTLGVMFGEGCHNITEDRAGDRLIMSAEALRTAKHRAEFGQPLPF